MERALLCEIPDKRRKTCVQGLFFLEIEVEQFLMSAICNAAISRNRIKYSKNATRKDSIKYNSFISAYIACVVGIKKGGEEGRKKSAKGKNGRERRLLPLSPIPPSFFPSSLSPTPFDTCYAGHNIHRVRYFRRLWKSGADSFQNRFMI